MGSLTHTIRNFNPTYLALSMFLVTSSARALDFVELLGVGELPLALAVGDLDRNGWSDLATADNGSGSVSLLFGFAPLAFRPRVQFPLGARPSDLDLGDLDGDGYPDFAVALVNRDVVDVFFFRPASGVTTGGRLDVGTGPAAVELADLDGDGRLDVLCANTFDGSISVYLGRDGGTFVGLGEFVTGAEPDPGPVALGIGDLNGDRIVDLAVANQLEDSVSLFFGGGGGAFVPGDTIPAPVLPSALAVGDLSGDGVEDLVVASEAEDQVRIFFGDGAGGIAGEAVLLTGGVPQAVALGDLDGNGTTDLVTADSFDDAVSVFLSAGSGSFEPRRRFRVGRSPIDVVLADLDRDGRLDIVTANLDGNNLSILRNTGDFRPPLGDLDADGTVDDRDVALLVRELFDGDGDLRDFVRRGTVRSSAMADANLDGFLGAADLVAAILYGVDASAPGD